MGAFFAFRKGAAICVGLDLYISGSVENRQFSLPHLCLTPNLKMFPLLNMENRWKFAYGESEDTGLISRVIKFYRTQRMWSQSINVTDGRMAGRTDRQTPHDGNTVPML